MNAPLVILTPAQAEELRETAWRKYVSIAHADIRKGYWAYRQELDRIAELEGRPSWK